MILKGSGDLVSKQGSFQGYVTVLLGLLRFKLELKDQGT